MPLCGQIWLKKNSSDTGDVIDEVRVPENVGRDTNIVLLGYLEFCGKTKFRRLAILDFKMAAFLMLFSMSELESLPNKTSF